MAKKKVKANEMEDGRGFQVRLPARTVDIADFRIFLDEVECVEDDDGNDLPIWKWVVAVGNLMEAEIQQKEFNSFDEALKYVASFAKN